MDKKYERKGNDILFEYDGKTFIIHTDGIKRKKLLKVAKLMKKAKQSPETLLSALEEAGIKVSVEENGHEKL